MFQIESGSKIVENIIRLSKESYFHPFEIEYTVMYQNEKEKKFIQDERNHEKDYLKPGPILETLLSVIIEEKITSYPFSVENFNAGTPIDEIDFFIDSSSTSIEATPDFMRFLREQDYIDDYIIYEENENLWVEAPHLTKFQLTFDKTSDLSSLSFQMFSRYPTTLLSLVSEVDLIGTNPPEIINLKNTTVSKDEDTTTILFGKPIYTKRLTFVMGQYNADDNNYSQIESEG